MQSLTQRRNECSLCSIATLNGFSQLDYRALSDLVREAGANYLSSKTLVAAINLGIKISRALGLRVPKDYPGHGPVARGGIQPVPSAFKGKGIVRVQFKAKRCRKWTAHVLAFKSGVLYDSEGIAYKGWSKLAKAYADAGSRDLIITRIFK